MPIISSGAHQQVQQQNGAAFSLEEILPLELVREHTRTDDVPNVSDRQLELYRHAALVAAHEYTGLLLTAQEVRTESVTLPQIPMGSLWVERTVPTTFEHQAEQVFAENFVWFYGIRNSAPQRVPVTVGSSVAQLPRTFMDFGLGCCTGKGSNALIQYVAGFDCVQSIPPQVQVGALKYIAHLLENPGDNVSVSTVGGAGGGVGVGESSNPAWASGAIEVWRSIKRDAL